MGPGPHGDRLQVWSLVITWFTWITWSLSPWSCMVSSMMMLMAPSPHSVTVTSHRRPTGACHLAHLHFSCFVGIVTGRLAQLDGQQYSKV